MKQFAKNPFSFKLCEKEQLYFFKKIIMWDTLSVQLVCANVFFFQVFNISKLAEVLFDKLEHVEMIIRMGNQACN